MSLKVGSRVSLRRLSRADLVAFQAYRGDAEVGRWQGWSPLSDSDATGFLDECADAPLFTPGQWLQLGIAERDGQALVGDIGLHLAAAGDEVEIGFTLARQAQGRGLAAEAVALAAALAFERNAAVQRLLAITDSRNSAALRLLDRGGWRRTVLLPALFRGHPCLEQHFVRDRA